MQLGALSQKLHNKGADVVSDDPGIDAIVVMDVLQWQHSEEVLHFAQ